VTGAAQLDDLPLLGGWSGLLVGGVGQLSHEILRDAVEESLNDVALQVVTGGADVAAKQQVYVLFIVRRAFHDFTEDDSMTGTKQELGLELGIVPHLLEDPPAMNCQVEQKLGWLHESASVDAV